MVSASPNKHIHEFLKYFLELKHSPFYSVLVSGVWGIGKTYLVKDILKRSFTDQPVSYVSLYGLDSVDAIDTALYQTLHPMLSSKGVKIAGRAGKAILKYVKLDGVVQISDLPSLGKDRLYVFDDLERASMNIDLVLGYINEMVEHDGCKVLIIGNEEKLLENPSYPETKEKLIGRILEVQPEVTEAFNHFASQLTCATARDILVSHTDSVILTFSEATATNFRVLQQTIWDFERIVLCLEPRHLQDAAGIRALLTTFFAISLETKSGNLSKSDLLTRPDGLMRAMTRQGDQQNLPPLDAADRRFSEADLYDPVANNTVLCDLLFKGMADPSMWRESLDQSAYYVDLGAEPAWRAVWHGFERDQEDFDHALVEMEAQFEHRDFTESGEILHVVGMRLWLASISALPFTREEVLVQAREYVEDLYAAGRLAPKKRDIYRDEFQGYGGLGIHEVETEDFREFLNFYNEKQSQTRIDLYPQQAEKLLQDMELDASQFLRQMCRSDEAGVAFANDPILAVIPPDDFVRRVMLLSAASRRKVLMALNIRYSHGIIERDLIAEKKWLLEVLSNFEAATESLPAMAKWGLTTALRQYIEPLMVPAIA